MKEINRSLYLKLITFISVIYLSVVYFYSINIPFWDDYETILRFLNEKYKLIEFFDWQKELFKQQNEHRIFLTKFIVYVNFLIFDQVNFVFLNIQGVLILIFGILYFLEVLIVSNEIKIGAFLIILNYSYFENNLFSMASIQNNGIIGLTFITLSLALKLLKNSKYLIWYLISIFLTVFTSGNGIFNCLIISSILIINKKWKYLLINYGFLLFLAKIYFNNFESLSNKNKFNVIFLNSFSENLDLILSYIGVFSSFLFKTDLHFSYFSAIISLLILSTLSFLYFKNKSFTLELKILTIICLITITIIFVNRFWIDPQMIFGSKYKVYPSIIIFIIFIILSQNYKTLKNKFFLLIIPLLFHVYTFIINYNTILLHKKQKQISEFLFYKKNIGLIHPASDFALMVGRESFSKGILNKNINSKIVINDPKILKKKIAINQDTNSVNLDFFNFYHDTLVISTKLIFNKNQLISKKCYLMLSSNLKTFTYEFNDPIPYNSFVNIALKIPNDLLKTNSFLNAKILILDINKNYYHSFDINNKLFTKLLNEYQH